MTDLLNGILELFNGGINIWALISAGFLTALAAAVLITDADADADDADEPFEEITIENLSTIIEGYPLRDDDLDTLKSITDNDDSIHTNETIIPVFYGTNRDVVTIHSDDSIEAGKYGTDKGRLRVGLAFVSIPKTHIMGKLDQPSLWRIDRRKVVGKHIYVKKSVELSKGWFQHLIAESSDGNALLFVHGFNTDFLGGLRRSAQLAFDLNVEKNVAQGEITSLPLTTFYFSWPSYGKPLKYVADQAQVDKSEEDLIEFLRLLKSSQGIKNITIIAHSMGNRLLTRALYGNTPIFSGDYK